jgi:alkanesulfonate monooxygenase SsuD/methylene tetrahydromethanopterin reductase-like flavin-dependent oxidoreductase (luciferase family)
MKFGVGWINNWDTRHTQTEVFDECVRVSVAAEELGYWSISVTEHHMANDPRSRPYGQEVFGKAYDLCTDTLTFLSYVAARTSRLYLKPGLVVAHYDHPARIAERAAMVDNMSHGEAGVRNWSGRQPGVAGAAHLQRPDRPCSQTAEADRDPGHHPQGLVR